MIFAYLTIQMMLVATALFLAYALWPHLRRAIAAPHEVRYFQVPPSLMMIGAATIPIMITLGFWRRLFDRRVFFINPLRDPSELAQFTGLAAFLVLIWTAWWFHGLLRGAIDHAWPEWAVERRLFLITLVGSIAATAVGI